MEINVLKNPKELGKKAAEAAAQIINDSIKAKGTARIVLSTGASQFDTIHSLISQDIDWTKVEMFHLDEYINLSEDHPASFRKYLKERFVGKLPLKKAHFVNGEGDVQQTIKELSEEINKEPIDLGLIGIGENAHIAFNDPPADFDTKEVFIVVDLDDKCKKQQVGEGWFASIDDVPKQAITMTVRQIMKCKVIISSVPYKVKANAIKQTLEQEISNDIPATMLKTHPDFKLFLEKESASLLNERLLKNG